MASIARVKLRWDGFAGGPGLSVFHFKPVAANVDLAVLSDQAVERIAVWGGAVAPLLPYQCGVQALSEVEILDEATGQLQEVRTAPAKPRSITTATASDNYAMAVGAVVSWRTGGVRNGRRVRGRTFIVPLNGTQFENNGTLRATAITTISNNSDEMYADTFGIALGIYARPSAPGASDGAWHRVTSHSIPDMGAVLRSRRD